MLNTAYAAYKKQSVTTMTPVEIVVKLYDECERQLNRGIHFMEIKDYSATNTAMMKAMDVVNALQSVLNMSIPISSNLNSLYDFFNREILSANMKKDPGKVKAILPMIAELKDAFVQVSHMTNDQIAAQGQGQGAGRVASVG